MCLLTYIPEDIQPDIEALRKGAIANSDGHGFAIVIPEYGRSGRILVRKSMRAEGLLKEFATLREMYPHGPAIFHSRITTDGATDLFNCHPIMVGGDKRTVVGHNGILPWSVRPLKHDQRSDTRIFAQEVAGRFQLHTMIGRRLAEEWMGSYNKMAVLTVDPAFDQYGYILNESHGEWHGGIWYSNGSYKGFGARTGGYSYSIDKDTGEWLQWEWCTAPGCTVKYASVSPYTLRCATCGCCSLCECFPCECVLVETKGGKVQTPPSASGDRNRTEATVVIGSPGNGATVPTATNWREDYETSVSDYWEALAAAHEVSSDDDPADDPANSHGLSQLQQILAMVDHLNSGGQLEDLDPEDQLMVIQQALDALEDEGLINPDDTVDTPQDDTEPRSSVVEAEGPRGDLIKRGDPGDDQEVLMLTAGPATRGLWDAD